MQAQPRAHLHVFGSPVILQLIHVLERRGVMRGFIEKP